MTGERRTSIDASVELIAAEARTQEELEEDAFRLLDAIHTEVSHIALGSTVACNFSRSSLELLITVEAMSTAEVHRKLSDVSAVIERLFGEDEVRTSTAPSDVSTADALCG